GTEPCARRSSERADDFRELFRVERGSADKRAVDALSTRELADGACAHAAPVQDRYGIRVEAGLLQRRAYRAYQGGRPYAGGRIPRPNRPDRLIRDHQAFESAPRRLLQVGHDLAHDNDAGVAGRVFGGAFANTKDRTQARRDGTGELHRDALVRVAKVATDLGVSDDGSHREPAHHGDRDLPRECSALLPVHVLRVDIDVRIAERIRDRG